MTSLGLRAASRVLMRRPRGHPRQMVGFCVEVNLTMNQMHREDERRRQAPPPCSPAGAVKRGARLSANIHGLWNMEHTARAPLAYPPQVVKQ